MGVLPKRLTSATRPEGFPYASGGVANKSDITIPLNTFSLRKWGCCQRIAYFATQLAVFPTQVGVLPGINGTLSIGQSFPYASGGVARLEHLKSEYDPG